MKEPVDHIIRPQLPWRKSEDEQLTECGYAASKVNAISRDEFLKRIKEFGQRRTAMMTCMTCANTAGRWGTWDDDPRTALSREIAWETAGGGYRAKRNIHGQRLKDELLAISALIDAHREEFDDLVDQIIKRRDWIDQKEKRQNRPKQPRRSL